MGTALANKLIYHVPRPINRFDTAPSYRWTRRPIGFNGRMVLCWAPLSTLRDPSTKYVREI